LEQIATQEFKLMTIRVLQVAGVLPNSKTPWAQPFILDQIESLRSLGLEVDVLDLSTCGVGWKKYLLGISRINTLLSVKHYDLIHAHYSYCGWAARFQWRVPVIVSLMGSDLLGIPDLRGRQTLRGHFDMLSSKILARWVDRIIVKSDAMAKLVHFTERLVVIPNGVDFNVFRPQELPGARAQLNMELNKKVILFAANPENPVKNFRLAEEAMNILQNQGNGHCVLLPFYKHSHSEVPAMMNASDMLLLTSFSEGSPNVIKEALACNLPIVSVRVGDVPEVLDGVENCYLADYDPMDIAAKINLVLQSGGRSNGRQHINHLRMEIIAGKLVDTYLEMINPK
jgi:glycosyltransferase involved in cell wall biosynthesis